MDDMSTWTQHDKAMFAVQSRIIDRADIRANGWLSPKVLWGKALIYLGSELLEEFLGVCEPRIPDGDCSKMCV